MRKHTLRYAPKIVARFWNKVVKSEGCWLWQGKPDHAGYGQFWCSGVEKAHRFSWQEHYGPIPEDRFVLHRCDVKLCVRPDHLHLGTHADNVEDARQNNIALGRPVEINRKDVKDLRAQGFSFAQIAAVLGCSKSTAYRAAQSS